MATLTTQILQDGRIVILNTRKQHLQKAKDLIKQFAKPNGSVVDELIAERREAAQHE